jgi:diguanylate cyclase (GGDEF)-like protein/putative nucleotidyltransferase with HDIG domain
MPSRAKFYIGLVIALGLFALATGLTHWRSHSPVQFVCYLLIAALASGFKVTLPSISGTMSVSSLFLLISLVQLSQAETLVIGVVGTLIQCCWKPKARILVVRVAFSVAAACLSIVLARYVYDFDFKGASDNVQLLRVLSTACGYFFVNTCLIAAVVALSERRSIRRVWLECYFWCFPYYLGGAVLAWLATIMNTYIDWQASLALVPIAYFVYHVYKLYLQRLEDEKKHVEEMAGLHLRTIEALALAIEAKDHTTHDHLRRVRIYALELGERMGLGPVEIQSLRAAALLHDIGKLAVPEHIISKPGKLTPEEFEKMKIHPVVGAQILEQVQFPYPVVPVVLSHHEKWDGTGYPSGLRGKEIPVGARILSAVDCLDALASDRQYRRALPLEEAMRIVSAESGKAFDPEVVAVLQGCYRELERKALAQPHVNVVRLDTDMKIERGSAPATGFETPASTPEFMANSDAQDPLISIAAARQEVQSLYELTQDLGNSLSLSETLSVVGARLKRLIPYDSVAVYIRREQRLIPEYVNGDNFKFFSSLEIPVGEGLSGWVAENVKPMLNGNPSVEAGYLNDPQKFSTMRSALAVPLVGLNGSIGVLTLYRQDRDAFSTDNLRILLAVSFKVSMAIDNALRYRQVETSATVDYLTNLPNARSLFISLNSQLTRCREDGLSLAVVVCDLDGFKQVNDRFGHPQGDKILRYVAGGLRDLCRLYETAARIGGDEFVLVIPGVNKEILEERIREVQRVALEAARQTPEPSLLSFSVGAAIFPTDGLDADTLLSQADQRMYRSKQDARDRPSLPIYTLTHTGEVATPVIQ